MLFLLQQKTRMAPLLMIALFLMYVVEASVAAAQSFTSTSLSDTIGAYPIGALVQGTDGNLYGPGFYGGLFQKSTGLTLGTLFRLSPAGTLSLIHDFHFAEGSQPTGLVLETNGNLYGTTASGGANPCGTGGGCGTVFAFTSGGTLKTLYSFSSTGVEGVDPVGGLTIGPDGSTLYGTAQQGGTPGCGTIFKITPTGTPTVLHTFDCNDGAYPIAPLVLGTNGNLYGTTQAGGLSGTGSAGAGTVFEITSGGTFTTIHNFNFADGAVPMGALEQAADGNFYGVTYQGGSHSEGTFFVISPGGRTFQTLYNFTGGSDGGTPGTGLVLGADGNFYGTTSGSGQNGMYGTVFKITPAGFPTTLHTFDGTDGGNFPTLMQHTNGTFYGTTRQFGANNNCPPVNGCGTVFSLSTDLGPFVTAVPSRRGTGARVLILGQGFTGATKVTFNGVTAQFTINSDTEITTFVPSGASKGFIQVTTPSGMLTSKVMFIVG